MTKTLRAVLLGGTLLTMPGVAFAQSMPASPQSASTPAPAGDPASPAPETSPVAPADSAAPAYSDDIIVTAQKREENVQKVPINITAFGATKLSTLSVNNVQDLTAYVPSFRVTQPGDPAVSALSLRGVGQRDINVHNEGAVALFVDQTYVSFIPAVAQPIFDVERVEVLKGPQGTLFGRNATGGLISIVSKKPSSNFDFAASAQYASFNDAKLEAAIGGPLTSSLSARLSISYNYADGFVKNNSGPALNATNSLAGRLQLKWEPTSTFRYSLSLRGWRFFDSPSVGLSPTPFVIDRSGLVRKPTSYADYAAFCAGVTHGLVPTPAGAQLGGNCFIAQPDPLRTSASSEARYNQTYYAATGTGELDLTDRITLTSITDLQYLRNDFLVDEDSTPASIFNYRINDKGSRQFSQEVRLNGSTPGFKWVAGLYYLNIYHDILVVTDLYNHPGFGVRLPADYQQRTASIALFGQVDVDLAPKLSLSLGVRGTRDHKSLDNDSTCISNPAAPPNLCAILGTAVFPGGIAFNQTYRGAFTKDSWSGRAVLQYKPSDSVMIYGGVTRGTKSGGFNSGGAEFYPAAAVAFRPEVLTNYEIGFKGSTPDRTLSVDASVFYYDYKDYQSFAASTDGGLRILNVNARVKGAELSVTLRPMAGLSLTVAGTYLDTLQKNVPLPGGGTGRFQMPDAPKWSLNGEIRYGFAIKGDDEFAAQLNGVYVGERSISAIDYPDERIPSYTRFDARISYALPGKKWTIAAFANNFTDEKIIATRVDFVGQIGAAVDTIDRPRWFGGSVSYRY